MRTQGGAKDGLFFDSSPVGWLMRLLFFPSGVISLFLIILLLKRAQVNSKDERTLRNEAEDRDQSSAALRPKRMDDKRVRRLLDSLRIDRRRQKELQLSGRIDENSCGYCLGEGPLSLGYVQLPCGHFHHGHCFRRALRMNLIRCADCGDRIQGNDKLAEQGQPVASTSDQM